MLLRINTPTDCDDGNACTVDSCDAAAGGCLNVPLDCGDGDLCTLDVCVPTCQCVAWGFNPDSSLVALRFVRD